MGSETRRKTKMARVRMTPDEWSHIAALADTCGLSVPEFMRQMSLGYTPKSNIDVKHRLNVIKLIGDLGRIGGLLKLWLSTDNIKSDAFSLEVPKVISELKQIKQAIEQEYRNL